MDPKCPHLLAAPFNMVVAGPSGAGKSVFVKQLLKSSLIDPKPTRIIYVYAEWQKLYEDMQASHAEQIHFIKGWSPQIYDTLTPEIQTVLILDDIMHSIGNDRTIAELFTVGGHHRNTSVILLVQNYWAHGSTNISIRRNTHYLVLFASRQDKRQIARFASQAYPNYQTAFMRAFDDATAKKHSFLLIDLRNECPEQYSLRANLFDDFHRIYQLT